MDMLLSNLNLLATAPGGVARLRELILTLAVQGKLVPQDPRDEPANELLKKIRADKNRLIANRSIRRLKPLDPIDESECGFALPSNWEWARLGNLGDWGAGATPSRGAKNINDLAQLYGWAFSFMDELAQRNPIL